MSFLRENAHINSVKDILKLNTKAGIALIQSHSAVIRQDSQFTVGERELIAAYVSGLNACQYCHGVHKVTAETFGIESELSSDLIEDLQQANVDDRLKPVLARGIIGGLRDYSVADECPERWHRLPACDPNLCVQAGCLSYISNGRCHLL